MGIGATSAKEAAVSEGGTGVERPAEYTEDQWRQYAELGEPDDGSPTGETGRAVEVQEIQPEAPA